MVSWQTNIVKELDRDNSGRECCVTLVSRRRLRNFSEVYFSKTIIPLD